MEGEQALEALHTMLEDRTKDVDRNKVKTLEVNLAESKKKNEQTDQKLKEEKTKNKFLEVLSRLIKE